jgi:hypothetical protein
VRAMSRVAHPHAPLKACGDVHWEPCT